MGLGIIKAVDLHIHHAVFVIGRFGWRRIAENFLKKDCGLLSRSSPISEASRASASSSLQLQSTSSHRRRCRILQHQRPICPVVTYATPLLLCGIDRQDCLSEVPTSLLQRLPTNRRTGHSSIKNFSDGQHLSEEVSSSCAVSFFVQFSSVPVRYSQCFAAGWSAGPGGGRGWVWRWQRSAAAGTSRRGHGRGGIPRFWSRPSARPCGPCSGVDCRPMVMAGGDVVGNDGGHGWYLSSVGWDRTLLWVMECCSSVVGRTGEGQRSEVGMEDGG